MNNEAVFIAWGRNLPLAKEVAKRLKERGFAPSVGGEVATGGYADLWVGAKVLTQIRKCTCAIVLAQSFTNNGDPEKAQTELRPNLLFEWGYLVSRLRSDDLYVYLIDIDRRDLPSDILGSWSECITFTNVEEVAARIVDNFCARFVPCDPIPPLKILAQWKKWHHWMHRQIQLEEQPSPSALAWVMVNSIQPAFYHGDIADLSALSKAAGDLPTSPELESARRVVSAVCDFYEITARERRDWRVSDLKLVRDKLGCRTQDSCDPTFWNWAELVRNDFLGLVNYHMAEISQAGHKCDVCLFAAEQAFNESLSRLENVSSKDGIWHLWNGYVRRNLGRVHLMLGRTSEAIAEFECALKSRQEAFHSLQVEHADRTVITQLHVEVELARLDLLNEKPDAVTLADIQSTFRDYLSDIRLIGLWKQAIIQARQIAVKVNDVQARKNFDGLMRSLGVRAK
jgi:Predicted nucleotide-binding protein containing TIR-like domain